MDAYPTVQIKPVVRFREYPFGTRSDPSMREFFSDSPRQDQDKIVAYLRSGLVSGYPMGGRIRDPFDPSSDASVQIDGQWLAGAVIMIDGEWFWYAGLIYFVEKYNVLLPDEFVEHARSNGWRVDRKAIPIAHYECEFFARAKG